MRKLLHRGFLLALCKAMESILGFLFVLLMLAVFGANLHTDALFGAIVLSVGICQMVPTVISQVLVPSLLAVDMTQTTRKKFLGSMSAIVIALGLLLGGLSILWPYSILAVSAPGLKAEALKTAYTYTSLLAPVFICTMLFGVIQGILHSERRFFMVEMGQIAWKASPLVGIFLALRLQDLDLIALSFSIGAFLRLLIATWALGLARVNEITPCLPQKGNFPTRALKLLGTEGILIGSDWCLELIFRSLASLLPVGGLSIFNYAERLCRNIPGMVLRGFGVVLLPDMTQLIQVGGLTERRFLANALYIATVVGLICSGVMFFGAPLAAILFAHITELNTKDLHDLMRCIQGFSPYVLCLLFIMILQTRFFLRSQVKILLMLNIVQGTTLVLVWLLSPEEAPQHLVLAVTVGILAKTCGTGIVTYSEMRLNKKQ